MVAGCSTAGWPRQTTSSVVRRPQAEQPGDGRAAERRDRARPEADRVRGEQQRAAVVPTST